MLSFPVRADSKSIQAQLKPRSILLTWQERDEDDNEDFYSGYMKIYFNPKDTPHPYTNNYHDFTDDVNTFIQTTFGISASAGMSEQRHTFYMLKYVDKEIISFILILNQNHSFLLLPTLS